MSASLNQRAAALILGILAALPVPSVRAGEGAEDADAAIRAAVKHLGRLQRVDGEGLEHDDLLATSFAILFLRPGQEPPARPGPGRR